MRADRRETDEFRIRRIRYSAAFAGQINYERVARDLCRGLIVAQVLMSLDPALIWC